MSELEALGVARITVGSALMRATLGKVKKAVEELKNSGTYDELDDGIPYAEVNSLLSR